MEQFLYGLFPDAKYRFIKSPGVSIILSDESIQRLRQHAVDNGEPYWLPTEQVVAIQYITRVTYDKGLTGVWNYTLLIPIQEYIRRTDPVTRFKPYIIHNESEAPMSLPSIEE